MYRLKSSSHFIRHYLEMVASMFLGMFILMAPAGALLGVAGTSWSDLSPAMNSFLMAITMGVPMAAWMRYRGHAWKPTYEMVGAMFVPTLTVMALLGTHVVGDGGSLGVFEHVGMLVAMLVAMLVRRADYSHGNHAAHAI
jgi:hypothetical protein